MLLMSVLRLSESRKSGTDLMFFFLPTSQEKVETKEGKKGRKLGMNQKEKNWLSDQTKEKKGERWGWRGKEGEVVVDC